jgi:hypothetical protein
MHVAAESTFEHVLWLYLNSFRTLADLVPNLGAIVANVILRFVFGKLFEKLLCALEVFLDEDLGMIVRAFSSFFAKSIHVVPAELTDNMFKFACFAVKAEAHIKVGAALIDVSKGTVLALLALLPHKIGANLQVVAEVALISVPASAHTLKFIAGLDFALVVGVGAIIG